MHEEYFSTKTFIITINSSCLTLYFTDTNHMGIDIDPVNNLLYLADNGKGTIKVIDFAAKQVRTLISNNVSKPIGILVDSSKK